MEAFDKATEDTITVINTGCLRSRDGAVVAEGRGKSYLENAEWRRRVDGIVTLLGEVRQRYATAVALGQIRIGDERHGRHWYRIYDPNVARRLDALRHQAVRESRPSAARQEYPASTSPAIGQACRIEHPVRPASSNGTEICEEAQMSDEDASVTADLPDLAFYDPNPMWSDAAWIKNLILFFDGVALLIPSYMRDRPLQWDPEITTGLQDQGLLRLLEPETVIDKQATRSLATALIDILASGALDDLAKTATQFHELSYSRLGYMGDPELAEIVYKELEERGLAQPSKDGVSIPMHPMVRSLILVLLAQILRPAGKNFGVHLSPATDDPGIHEALKELLGLPTVPSAGHVVSSDMQAVDIDLSSVPMDEVLRFRADNGSQFRAYARDLYWFVRDLATLPADEQQKVMRERHSEIADAATRLARSAQQAWRKRAAFAMSIAGAVWKVVQGDYLGALLSAGPAVTGASLTTPIEAGAYSYLFHAKSRFRA